MRLAGTDLQCGPDFGPRGGFADATTSVGIVSAMVRYPLMIRIVVRPARVLLTPVSAAPC